jgi:hypothetical protein
VCGCCGGALRVSATAENYATQREHDVSLFLKRFPFHAVNSYALSLYIALVDGVNVYDSAWFVTAYVVLRELMSLAYFSYVIPANSGSKKQSEQVTGPFVFRVMRDQLYLARFEADDHYRVNGACVRACVHVWRE